MTGAGSRLEAEGSTAPRQFAKGTAAPEQVDDGSTVQL